MACKWFHLNTADVNTYPSGNMSSRDLSRTTTATSSAVLNAAKTRINGFQIGPSHAGGDLEIRVHDSTTIIRKYDVSAVSGTNMGANECRVPFNVDGPWCAFATSGAAVDLYIQYEDAPEWP